MRKGAIRGFSFDYCQFLTILDVWVESVLKKLLIFWLGLLTVNVVHAQRIGDFTSLQPQGPLEHMVLPPTHDWQMLIRTGDSLTTGGVMPVNSDFTGYVPILGSSRHGYLSVSSEAIPGGVTVLEIEYDSLSGLWGILNSHKVDFSAFEDSGLVGTARNCSGAVTPWGTVITCEEQQSYLDLNQDGYFDLGWAIEINPVTHTVVDHDRDHIPDKLWALGNFRHENAAFASDSVTVYQGEDDVGHGFLFKFVAHQPMQLDSGDLFVLQVTGDSGVWLQVPNVSQWDRNRTVFIADSVGGTKFYRIEDVEIGPDGKVYFASTFASRVYRFLDLGDSVQQFEIFIDYGQLPVQHRNGVSAIQFAVPDNLVFDGEGNLWVAQDGSGNHLLVFGPGHTTISPDVRVFTTAVRGSEPTGMTFSPDFRFLFMSFQHPSYGNYVPSMDASGTSYRFNRDATFVFSLAADLGNPLPMASNLEEKNAIQVFPNPSSDWIWVRIPENWAGEKQIQLVDLLGRKLLEVEANAHNPTAVDIQGIPAGNYLLTVKSNDRLVGRLITKR